ncbi:hypothetical protein CC78DRAFT_159481 [Lojkania enalia]|uniref:Uncharacterized protein n=1 Tax=Lojkania enalia TaxID=147567 RepID=A0A9P4JZN6_9PLEO|nr:hypothetical protein CC78DRAFT_159481 [Didymosphaeria enalia]
MQHTPWHRCNYAFALLFPSFLAIHYVGFLIISKIIEMCCLNRSASSTLALLFSLFCLSSSSSQRSSSTTSLSSSRAHFSTLSAEFSRTSWNSSYVATSSSFVIGKLSYISANRPSISSNAALY